MSLRASYARLTKADAEALRADPEFFRKIPRMPFDLTENPTPNNSEWLNLDREWLSLSWLCSPVGRAEERNNAAFDRVMDCKANGEDLSADGAFKAALVREAERIGYTYVDPDEMADDPVLAALQGRRGEDKGETIENLGISSALFSPTEVVALAEALANVREADMREAFDIEEMEALYVPNDGEESDFEEFFLPQLRALQTLYARAARAEQYVVVAFDNEFIMVVGEPGPDFWEGR
jgi:Domain of unknown function (DUF1877)